LDKAQKVMLQSIGAKREPQVQDLEVKNTKSNGGEWEECKIESPSFFHKFLCGRGGVVKKRLEQETGTLITIPRPAEKADYITVKAKTGTAISSLETRVESIVFNARKRQKPTHFLCIPVVSDEITQNMAMLLDLCEDAADITPDMIQKTVKLHFTIGVLRLFSSNEVDDARTALAKFAPQIPYILHGQPLKGELKGLDIMNDDPSSVKVLYSEVILHDESERLQMLVDALQTHFVESGLMNYEHNRESVKLHCTLINSKWKKDKDGPIIPFNATELMQYSDINFGEVTLGTLDFNEMKTDSETGAYVNCCRIKLDSK